MNFFCFVNISVYDKYICYKLKIWLREEIILIKKNLR